MVKYFKLDPNDPRFEYRQNKFNIYFKVTETEIVYSTVFDELSGITTTFHHSDDENILQSIKQAVEISQSEYADVITPLVSKILP